MIRGFRTASANLTRVRSELQTGVPSRLARAQILILIHSAAEALLRAYLNSATHLPRATRRAAGNHWRSSFPDLVRIMAETARPPLDSGRELIELNERRIQAAHPSAEAIEPSLEYLSTALHTVEGLYNAYAEDTQQHAEMSMSENEDSTWIERRTELATFRRYMSTGERRIVLLRDGVPILVPPVGWCYPRLRRADTIIWVNMLPRRVIYEFAGDILSQERVPLRGRISMELVVKNEESAVQRIALDPEDEQLFVEDALQHVLQSVTSQFPWDGLHSTVASMNLKLEEGVKKALAERVAPVALVDLHITHLGTADSSVAEAAFRRAQDKETAATELAKLAHAQSMLDAEKRIEALQVTRDREIARERLQMIQEAERSKLELARETARTEREIEAEKIENKIRYAELLASEAGQLTLFPAQVFAERLKKLEVAKFDGEAQRQFFRDMLKAYATFRAGEHQALRDVLSTQSNIRLSSTALPAPEMPYDDAIPIAAQIAQLSELGSVRKRGEEILFVSEDGRRIEIHLSSPGNRPEVWVVTESGKVPMDLEWWSSRSTLRDILDRLAQFDQGAADSTS